MILLKPMAENWAIINTVWCPSSVLSSALFAPRMSAARPGQKSPTALPDDNASDKDKEDAINYTTIDWREFMCNTWHLEPTLRSERLKLAHTLGHIR